MDIKRKESTLFWIFLKQLIILSLSVLIEIIIFLVVLQLSINMNIILPANYSERAIIKNKEAIAQSEPFDRTLIPSTCTYGIFDTNYQYIEGNLSKDVIDRAKQIIEGESTSKHRFYVIPRKDTYCVIQYTVTAQFNNRTLHRVLPNLEIIGGSLFLSIFIALLLVNAASVGKRLKKELKPLLDVVDQIQKKELEFEMEYSTISEFNQVLIALHDMKVALSDSLEKEWESEQMRKSHISALAHDIRTPLTIMKGNAELILEENELIPIYEDASIICSNIDKIERYIKLLIEATKNEFTVSKNNVTLTIDRLLNRIITEAEDLCKAKEMELVTTTVHQNETILVDQELISRAIINIIKNAIEHSYSSFATKVCASFIYKEGILQVSVEDYGSGFSEEALKNATKQFFTDRKERANENYGLGMYIASEVAKGYNGTLVFYNKKDVGAIVTITFRI
jgi:two-component system, OmpR family, lantibiotic biosynthesis sensor histidine kinase NisK/SpaK